MDLWSHIFSHFPRLAENPDDTDLGSMRVLGRCLRAMGLSAMEANTSFQRTACGLASCNVYCGTQLRSENVYLGCKKNN